MSATSFDDPDLSDDWIERPAERPPTLKIGSGSLSGSVNVLSDATQRWSNVQQIVSKDLLTKQTKPLTSLFEPPAAQCVDEGLSVVVEEESCLEDVRPAYSQQSKDAWADLSDQDENRSDVHDSNSDEGQEQSPATTIRAGTARSAEGLIPNFSFPRTTISETEKDSVANARHTALSDSSSSPDAKDRMQDGIVHNTFRSPESDKEPDGVSTPKRHTHKTSNSSVSPTKSPLKLFHAEQDTFTRDHTARMIGILAGASAPPLIQVLDDVDQLEPQNNTQKSQISGISMISDVTDSGPDRKKVKTHESKGSVTLQNFNDNADRLAAKLRAKSGGLGKGLPRVLEDTKVILGRRISSAADRLDQQRRKERSIKGNGEPQPSGFESLESASTHFIPRPQSNETTAGSHFSDWDSEGNPESRRVSEKTEDPHNDSFIAAHSIYDSVKQNWVHDQYSTKGQPQIVGNRHETRLKEDREERLPDISRRPSPRMKTFPPTAIQTLRHGDMVFDTSKGCWRHVDEDRLQNDPFVTTDDRRGEMSDRGTNYPDELDFSTSRSNIVPQFDRSASDFRSPGQNGSSMSEAIDRSAFVNSREMPSLVINREPSQIYNDAQQKQVNVQVADLANLTANMTMSQSTAYLLSAINKRYGEGPWEFIRELDLSSLELDSLVGLSTFFPSLVSLDVSNNTLTTLNDLPDTLQVLKANTNRLTSHHLSFNHLPNLQILQLDDNRLEDLDSLSPLIHLRHLSVARNFLTCLHGIRNSSALTSINCQGNTLQQIDFIDLQTYSSMNHLEHVDLSCNKLERLVGIDSLAALINLDITSNSLLEIEISNPMPRMKVLKASENDLEYLNLDNFKNLRILYLDDNQISEVALSKPLKYLESFSIRRQTVPELSLEIDLFCEVRKLFLSGNAMPDFRLNTTFHSLKYLELAGMQLADLPADFAAMTPNVRVLNLSNNGLLNLESLQGLNRLERLMVPNNKLSSVEQVAEIVMNLPRLKGLDLRANQFTNRLCAPIRADHAIDYFANFDGMRHGSQIMEDWISEDDQYQATMSSQLRRRREAYQNLIWTVCRALRWHDGRFLERQQLLMADEYVNSFTQESLTA